MKWVVIASFIVCLATFSKGHALSRSSESKDAAPTKDEEPIELTQSSTISEVSKTSEVQCLAGSEWTSNCYSCRCSEDGVATCTKLETCKGRYAEPIKCKPQTKFLRDCNVCLCLNNGKSLCTLRLCITADFKTASSQENKSDLVQIYEFDNHKVLKRSSICKPNALMKADCNFCKCASDGQSYSCTLNECEEPDLSDDVEVFKENENNEHDEDQVSKVCKPRATFHIGCNTCNCNFDGTSFTCTNKPCPLPDDVELFDEIRVLRTSPNKKSVVCLANRMFIKDCNTCWCNEDGTSYFCTRKVCVTEEAEASEEAIENHQEAKRKCVPDEVFELDCNTCRCSQDGMSFSCTRRACVPEEKGKNVSLNRRIRATSQVAPKACTPGQEFRMDCNKCLCNNEGQDFSCTRMDCTAMNNNGNVGVRAKRDTTTQVQLDCEPGSVFKQGCNLCHCTEDGKHATCALKRCIEKDTQEESLIPESDPSFRCNPGEQTKRGCNDCSCSADGKSVFCTLRFCDQDITPTI